MKKLFLAMMAIAAIAFSSCKPHAEEPNSSGLLSTDTIVDMEVSYHLECSNNMLNYFQYNLGYYNCKKGHLEQQYDAVDLSAKYTASEFKAGNMESDLAYCLYIGLSSDALKILDEKKAELVDPKDGAYMKVSLQYQFICSNGKKSKLITIDDATYEIDLRGKAQSDITEEYLGTFTKIFIKKLKHIKLNTDGTVTLTECRDYWAL